MIKNIILDVGRVLVAWQPKETMRELGIPQETIAVLAEKLFDSGVWNEADRGVLSDDEFLQLAIRQVPEYEAELCLFWNNIEKAIWQFPYAKLWIRAMKKAGYQVYILSNYGNWCFEKTKERALNFLEEADGAVFSYEAKQIKPDAEIFQALCDKYSLKAEECVFLDDLPANIEGAKKFGMQGIVFKGLQDALEELQKLDVKIAL